MASPERSVRRSEVQIAISARTMSLLPGKRNQEGPTPSGILRAASIDRLSMGGAKQPAAE